MAKQALCSCLKPEDWLVIQKALTDRESEVSRIRKRITRTFNLVPGAIEEKKVIVMQLDMMEQGIVTSLERLAATPKCDATGKVPAAKKQESTTKTAKKGK